MDEIPDFVSVVDGGPDPCRQTPKERTGFIGLGHMGEPMARRLVRTGLPLQVWNRSEPATQWFKENGVTVAETAAQVFDQCPTVILMLANGAVANAVLGRGTRQFERRVAGRTIVNMGTTSPEFSKALEEDIISAGGRFVECPVSGSRVPAEEGSLVAMLAGADDGVVNEVESLVSPMCARAFQCGPVPRALMTKLAVNHFLITMVTGLVEAAHFAQCHKLNLEQVSEIIACGPMASKVSTGKLQKIAAADLSVQASLRDVLMNTELIAEAARQARIASPLLDNCLYLYREADGLGLGGCDMIAVLGSLEALTAINNVDAHAAAAEL
jgi:3-hydroxyisobutyrate dehydrogenase